MTYISLNIHKEILLSVSEKITGEKRLYTFPENVIKDNKACYLFSSLYKMIISGQDKQKKEQVFLLLIKLLSEKYGKISKDAVMPYIYGVEMACLFIQKNWDKHITLEQLCKCSHFNQQALLRAFKKSKGITPYRYLQALRIEKAKQLLEKGESGGEAQKIAIARAMYKDSPFVLLDEPTAALDPIAEYGIYTNFDKITGTKTAIYISHRLSSCQFCEKIAVFHEGRLVQYGNHNGLLKDHNGKYYEMWNEQAKYYQKN